MANSDRLAEVTAMLAERDEDFEPIIDAAIPGDEPMWPLSALKELLGYTPDESIEKALNRAKIAAKNAGLSIKEHFHNGDLGNVPDEIYLTKYAAFLVAVNADPAKKKVAIVQSYFALQADRQALEDEKRIKTRFDVANENRRLQGAASQAGVSDFQKFNGVGLAALYGGKTQAVVKAMKGLPQSAQLLDHAGSEELAANLFRITQTAAALRRQDSPNEAKAVTTHRQVAKHVRKAITDAGNTPPEKLPASAVKVDLVATQVKKKLKGKSKR